MRKRKIFTGLGLILAVGAAVYCLFTAWGGPEREQLRGMVDEMEQINAALEEAGYQRNGVAFERLYPLVYSDQAGNEIHYYDYHVIYLEQDEESGSWRRREAAEEEATVTALYEKVLDPATAEASRAGMVGDIPAMFYDKEGRRYLWWSPAAGTTLVLDYDPATASEADIIRMAESVEVAK